MLRLQKIRARTRKKMGLRDGQSWYIHFVIV